MMTCKLVQVVSSTAKGLDGYSFQCTLEAPHLTAGPHYTTCSQSLAERALRINSGNNGYSATN